MLQSKIKEIYKIFNNNNNNNNKNKSNKHQILPKTTTKLKGFYKNGPKLIGKKFNTIKFVVFLFYPKIHKMHKVAFEYDSLKSRTLNNC